MSENQDLFAYIDGLRAARVLCIGDVMLDRYVYGMVDRVVSPEAPIPVLNVEREEKTLGGAGNVLRNLRALGAAATFVSVVGNDEVGREVEHLLGAEDGVEIHVLVQPQRMTPVKTRYIAANQHLLRADRENAIPLGPYTREDLLRLARELVRSHDVVVISDYANGVLTEGVALEIIRAAREAGAKVIVDPRGGDPIRYRGADVLKPSRSELGEATGMPVESGVELVAASRSLIERCGIGAVLVPLGPGGMMLVDQAAARVQPAPLPLGYAASGIGDTVVAILAAAFGTGVPVEAALRLAGAAAGIAAGKTGTAVVYASELAAFLHGSDPEAQAKVQPTRETLDIVAGWHREGLRVGFTSGCFDLLHPGHVALLAQAKASCDRLVVGLDADESGARLYGSDVLMQSETTRAAVIASLAVVDLVTIFDDDTPVELIRAIRPQLLVKGANYRLDEVVGADLVEQDGGRVLLADLMPGYGAMGTAARGTG